MRAGSSANRPIRAVLALAALVAFMLACDLDEGSGAGSPGADISGRYTLRQINGRSLPAGPAFIFDGTLDLMSDGTFSLGFSWQGELNAMRYTGEDGTFSIQGSTLTFTSKSDSQFSGQLSGQRLRVEYDFTGTGKLDQHVFAK